MIVMSSVTAAAYQRPLSESAPLPGGRLPIEPQPLRLATPLEVKPISQELKDSLARMLLLSQQTGAMGPPDNAPENVYAQVKVNGKVVATLYNSGASAMTNEAAALAGRFDEPTIVGPALAQWRAEAYAKALGGSVELAHTAKAPHEWQPRVNEASSFTRAELDRAFEAIRQGAFARQPAGLSPPRRTLDVSA